MKRPPTNIVASIHQRLLNLARTSDRPFNELLQYFAIERFLYRFSLSPYNEQFVLKGAQMLRAWEAPLARPTMDIDMLGGQTANTIENLERIVRECCAVEADDGVLFDTSSVRGEAINKDTEYQGMRVRVQGTLGKIKLNVQIDFGFGDVVVPKPVPTELPQLLDLGAPRLLGYTPESAIAEKFQAMIALDIANTRIKDFYDIWSLSRVREFDGVTLAAAISATFRRRSTPLPQGAPLALTDDFSEDQSKQSLWQAFLRKGRLDAEGKSLTAVVGEIRDFLMPSIAALKASREFRRRWREGRWQ
ncbi:MAG: nucleotidyl transferase AbiEii/AbiGii toxin family protein [Acidobacteriota bacterium]|nr:nucleotidyl transferase AbiEii/AbiGii toxin family protein [Acidobacteriota bacterium]